MQKHPIIQVEHVSKAYPLSFGKRRSIRHEAIQMLAQWIGQQKTKTDDRFYALRDVSFEIHPGESVAIIGRNGSGKTTLLRVLARITRPTTGKALVNGRFTALIGLGTGFHVDLTGRENIYLNGAIHGLKREEVSEIEEAIISFADIGQFIDVPVRDYSSGMRARLGFSVAINLMPDIVFIDEILSVGDEAFRTKSEAKIHQMIADEKTVVIVSHAMRMIRDLATRCIWLDHGEVLEDDSVKIVLPKYLKNLQS